MRIKEDEKAIHCFNKILKDAILNASFYAQIFIITFFRKFNKDCV